MFLSLSLAARTQTTYSRTSPTNFRELCSRKTTHSQLFAPQNCTANKGLIKKRELFPSCKIDFTHMPANVLCLNSTQQSNHHRTKSSSLVPELKLPCKAAKRLLSGAPRTWNCSLTSMNIAFFILTAHVDPAQLDLMLQFFSSCIAVSA